MRKQIYVSGPMTGYKDFNRAAFEEARAKGEALGYAMFIPGDGEEYSEAEVENLSASPANRAKWMHKDFRFIVNHADEVWVLPGWMQSQGARDEVRLAQVIGLPVVYAFSQYPVYREVVTHVR